MTPETAMFYGLTAVAVAGWALGQLLTLFVLWAVPRVAREVVTEVRGIREVLTS